VTTMEAPKERRVVGTLREFLAGEPSSEPLYFAYSASLRIFGTIPDLEEVSRRLGLLPTHAHRKGERRKHGAPYRDDAWHYTAPVAESEPLHTHIDTLWSAIRNRAEYLIELKRTMTVDVFCGYRSNCDTAGVEVPAASLEMFTTLQIPFGLSIIVA
jgi:hypothetical protein